MTHLRFWACCRHSGHFDRLHESSGMPVIRLLDLKSKLKCFGDL
jgi:hypothetical protein